MNKKKIKMITLLFVLLLTSNIINAIDYFSDKQTFINNQESITTTILKGSGNIVIKIDQDGTESIITMDKEIEFYSKQNDKIKLIISDEQEEMIVTQYDGQKYQKSSSSEDVIITPLAAPCDLYTNYFMLNLETDIANETVILEEVVTEDGKTLNKYIIHYIVPLSAGCDSTELYQIDESEIYFNQDGMIVKKIDYSSGVVKKAVEFEYVNEGDSYIATVLKTILYEGGAILENSIIYDEVIINQTIDDTVFQL